MSLFHTDFFSYTNPSRLPNVRKRRDWGPGALASAVMCYYVPILKSLLFWPPYNSGSRWGSSMKFWLVVHTNHTTLQTKFGVHSPNKFWAMGIQSWPKIDFPQIKYNCVSGKRCFGGFKGVTFALASAVIKRIQSDPDLPGTSGEEKLHGISGCTGKILH